MAAPAIPSGFQVQQADGEVLVSWDIVPGATAGYSVQRSLDGVTYTTVATPAVNEYLDTAVTPQTLYYYQVASSNGLVSGYTAPLQVIPTLAGQMTLSQLRLLAKQKADRVNSPFVSDSEWNTYINQSYFSLYDLLVQKYGNEYYVAPPLTISLTGAQFYDFPDGQNHGGAPAFYKLLGVDLVLNNSSNAAISLRRFNFISRNRYIFPQITANLLGWQGLQYRPMGNQLELIPTPASGQSIKLWYVPRMSSLLQDTDVVDGVSGWTEFIAIDAAIKALMKEESDVTMLVAARQEMVERIEAAAENRDAGEPETISKTRRYNNMYGDGYDGPMGGY